jgi:hypothetical protein
MRRGKTQNHSKENHTQNILPFSLLVSELGNHHGGQAEPILQHPPLSAVQHNRHREVDGKKSAQHSWPPLLHATAEDTSCRHLSSLSPFLFQPRRELITFHLSSFLATVKLVLNCYWAISILHEEISLAV